MCVSLLKRTSIFAEVFCVQGHFRFHEGGNGGVVDDASFADGLSFPVQQREKFFRQEEMTQVVRLHLHV